MLHVNCVHQIGTYCVKFILGVEDAEGNKSDHHFCPAGSPQFTGKDINKNESNCIIGTHDKDLEKTRFF